MKRIIAISIIAALPTYAKAGAVSFVYNMRIAETTRQQTYHQSYAYPFTGALTGINQWRRLYSGECEEVTGGIGTLLFSACSFYARVDGAVAR
ncbi:MAG TPA: hypothetical protein VHA52_11265, partial [Candidatus Babeliaceae bacterium]|nr:hypothetical protein [Candidatus Babeliaceae bacterium]